MNRAKRSAPWSRRRASAAAFSARALDRAARSRQVADFDGPERAPVPVIVFSAKEAPETIADRVSAALVKAHTSGEQLAETARGYILWGAGPEPLTGRRSVEGYGQAVTMRERDRILYVDDETDIRTITQIGLESVGGFTSATCRSGREALETAPGAKPQGNRLKGFKLLVG